MKKCPYCRKCFSPHVKVGDRQKTCGGDKCQKALKADNNKKWRQKNPTYFKDDYLRIKAWLEEHPGYLSDYRKSHPEYVGKNRDSQKVRDRGKKIYLDIQAQLKSHAADITKQLWEPSNLDIQAQLNIQPLEITFLFSTIPCLDIQVPFDRSSCVGDNSPICARRSGLCT